MFEFRSLVSVSLLGLCLSGSALAMEVNVDSNNNSAWKLDQDFLERQVAQSMSPGRSVRTLIGHYPESIRSIVSVALDTYPDKYKEIIHSAISAQPFSAEDVVTIAVEKGITECESIVETAIKAEPSYVSFVTRAATNASPKDFKDILRVAVVTEPESADKIIQIVAKSYPERIADILSSTLQYVPYVGEYVVDALLAVFPDKAEEVVEVSVREVRAETAQVEKVISAALNAGIDAEVVSQSAIKGGATTDEVMAAITKQSNNKF